MLIKFKKYYSPNFEIKKRRKKAIKFIILHYTGMRKEKSALNRLTSFNTNVSCHYFINYKGEVFNLVPELYTSWHAGKSDWRGEKNLNKKSIGIEISNPGHDHNYRKFNQKQINSLVYLIGQLVKKYKIKKENILGHSDIAPDRKKDPGEKFPWKVIYLKKLSIWHKLKERDLKLLRNKICQPIEIREFIKNLKKIGYKSKNNVSIINAFQRRFRHVLINGKIDKECLIISRSISKN